ncbi:ATP-dependent DNA helicase Rep [Xanthomonas hydrangeae]|nr:ATP-dependent DNA helicase Rep [Xanthomonas hydrangeae]CAD7731432.1 ATP-dependent DNA helicase Rep [Xanthomonas hydrangeae]CAD7747716.1 ATP-dependent DNA helicase Rep [Xanthomonas hydrangeae]CAD7747717.1 ATP-dependent DNA helicase Rep [Xanthomonas hydrangeae]
MTSRIGSPDTPADLEVRACLDREPPRSFVVVAGAGSGKTTSLIKALAHLGETRGPALRRAGQKIACITYTEVAVGEISEDVGVSPLFQISTIHSFLWSIVRPFHSDILVWVQDRIKEKIAERCEHFNKPRTQEKTKARLEQEMVDLEAELAEVHKVEKFDYGTGSSYAEGILGHDDILKLAPACIVVRPLLRQVIAARFPYIFVDESQDTHPDVVMALQTIAAEHPELCVGFFGDPMQRIYMGGAGPIELGEDWSEITKPENFRCPRAVLDVINAIRAEGDGLEQTRGRTRMVDGHEQPVEGTSNLFVLPSDGDRTACLMAVRQWLSEQTDDTQWLNDVRESDVRLLVLVHRMAASRLGFPSLYAALNDRAPMSLSEGLSDGTAWPLLPFVQHILPLVVSEQAGENFNVISILRSVSPKLEPDRLSGQDTATVLSDLQQAVRTLVELLAEGSQATILDVLKHVRDSELLRLDDRFDAHLADDPQNNHTSGYDNVQAFIACGIQNLWAYQRYFSEESPFATHHGVKGAQFERVLVVIDDDEANYRQYSYGKYLGYTPLSENDDEHIAAGEESVLDRTRRLFYVCCSRATKDLAVVIFVPNVEVARAAIIEKKLFPQNVIRGAELLG